MSQSEPETRWKTQTQHLTCHVTMQLRPLTRFKNKFSFLTLRSNVYKPEVATDPESTPAGFCVFLPDPDPDLESKILKNWTRIRGHLSISAVAGVCVVISEVSPLVIFGCIDCSRSLNRRRILKFKKFQDTDTDLKVLEQEQSRSLKKWLPPPLVQTHHNSTALRTAFSPRLCFVLMTAVIREDA